MTEFILIRHGETDWNRELRFQGQCDVPLNDIGRRQAQRLAERLAREPAHALISSDLQRACETAMPIGAQRADGPLAPELDAALREQHFGLAEGLQVADIKARHAAAWDRWIRFEADYAFDGGETPRQFHARVMAALQSLAQRHPGHCLLVVTHGGVLDMVYRTARGLSLSGPRVSEIPNAGLNRVRLLADRLDILQWADTRHLADLPPQPVYDQTRVAQGATAGPGDLATLR